MISPPDRRDAFLTLLGGCENRLRAFFSGALSTAEDRADLFQDVVLILWRSFEKYDPARPFPPWAMGVAVRRMKEEYRRKIRRPGLLAEDHLDRLAHALEAAEPESGAGVTAEEEALAECLAALPPQSARLVRLRYFDQTGIDALGAEFGQSPAAVYQNLSRLRRRLADCIRQRLRYSGSPEAQSSPLSAPSLTRQLP